jgi:OmpA-OmpF porin, OOP family
MKKLILLLTLVVVCPLVAQELDPDAEGCRDSKILSRMPKCRIDNCDIKDFDEADIRTSVDLENGPKTQHVEGAKEYFEYVCDASVSYLNIVRNAEAALKKAGFTIVFSGKGQNERPALAARKGGVWVGIQTETNGSMPIYYQTIVQSKQMEETMVADAAAMEAEINSSGYCSIYGILFDTGKATIQPESAKCLTEVVTLLKKNATWKMQIEGHTDNVGAKDANMKLSQARADAVRSWLVTNGIEGSRLTAKGFGDSKPKMENTTEDGRSKNRRVDLRKL